MSLKKYYKAIKAPGEPKFKELSTEQKNALERSVGYAIWRVNISIEKLGAAMQDAYIMLNVKIKK